MTVTRESDAWRPDAVSAQQARFHWRSALYPENWCPSDRDAQGRFLHDFSYAGYHRGERPAPDAPPGRHIDATRLPYGADPSGTRDATAALQQALDDAGAAGGGVVHLPAGTYRVRLPAGASSALYLRHSGVVLRGQGPEVTRLFRCGIYSNSSSTFMRHAGSAGSASADSPRRYTAAGVSGSPWRKTRTTSLPSKFTSHTTSVPAAK